jgi:toxin FitB
MKIGIDSSIIIAAVHANHPRHPVASAWLSQGFLVHEIVTAHHCLLEAYAVLTRLPGDLRVSPAEAKEILEGTIKPHVRIADFKASRMWEILSSLFDRQIIGGGSYDVFILEILRRDGIVGFATFNPSHFEHLHMEIEIIDPSR